MLVDWVWTSGTAAIKAAQRALGVKADGVVGPLTLAALNGGNAHEVFYCLRQARIGFYNRNATANPSQKKFLSGWLNRVNTIDYV